MITARVALLAWFLFPLCAQSDLPREVIQLARIRHQASEDLSHVPDFTCLETIERSSRRSDSKPFVLKDVVRVEVAHVGEHELFAWPGDSHFDNRSLETMIGSGMISSGEFVSHARSVFLGNMAVIRYAGEGERAGRPALRYEYEIAPAFSGYSISANGQSAIAGVRGSFWADSASHDLLFLSAAATEIPSQVGILETRSEIEYSRVRIGSHNVLLPQTASTSMLADTGVESRNRMDFTHCRQYASESVLSFTDDPAAIAARQTAPAEISEVALPPNVVCSLRLDHPLPLARARVGDAVSAILASDIKEKRQLSAPKGAVILGRLRMIEKDTEGYVVGLEFTDLTFPGHHSRFFAVLVSVDSRFARIERASVKKNFVGRGVETRTLVETPPELAGVGTFFSAPGAAELPAGMSMEWKTVALAK